MLGGFWAEGRRIVTNHKITKNSQIKDRTVAIIPAAGSGIRMGSEQAKQFIELDGRPLLALALQPFQDCHAVDAIILVVPA